MSATVTKCESYTYKIRNIPDHKYAWADITLDDNIQAGRIQVASDFGSWQYFWGHPGKDFKQFLCELSKDYLAEKFREDNFFDIEKTLHSLKKDILYQHYKDYGLTNLSSLRNKFKKINNHLAYEPIITDSGFYNLINKNEYEDLIGDLYDYPETFTKISPQFDKFWKLIWSVFIEEIKKEINNKKFKKVLT